MIKNPIFLMNAPKRCGKDTVATMMRLYATKGEEINTASFKDPLFDIFLATTRMDVDEFYHKYHEDEGWKDTPLGELNGKTVRDLLIHISETYIKPFFGKEFFGQKLVEHIKRVEEDLQIETPWVVPDCGFNEEVEAIIKEFGDRVVVVQFARDGFEDFGTDSRNWITTDKAQYFKGRNDGQFGSYELALRILKEFDLM